ncbi:protein-lysine N-methyltransferase EEF2KMT [Condylostylus longicornis]|uniref:protein-lysine N-methyltransferase EEF2KMT n=1 Tax=Condylostylus longicornis TaxID=2530218 RepID=UPI00244E02E1|nr:protein-lysine N-methyltransferase EEF2KMT [Condylostylus longicornis]
MDLEKYIDKLKAQFLSCFNINLINWENLKDITWDQQELILKNVIENELNKKFPIRRSYQLSFLKKIIEYFELNNIEIHDRIYERFCALNSTPNKEENLAYKHYLLAQNDAPISLKESKSFVAEGTTGLCSWQASLLLSNWIINNSEKMNNKTILELGAGTGLCSFTALKCCNPSEVMITDGSVKVLNLLETNLINNFSNLIEIKSESNYSKYSLKDGKFVSTFLLQWENIEKLNLDNIFYPNVILAADVIYDSSTFTSLCNTIDYIFKYMKYEVIMYLAATIRNSETVDEFLKILGERDFTAEKIAIESDKQYFYWDNTTPIAIYCITKGMQ